MIDQVGLGVNSVKSRLVDWILEWASLFIYFFDKSKRTTRVIKSVDEVLGFTQISHQDQELLTILIGERIKFREQ